MKNRQEDYDNPQSENENTEITTTNPQIKSVKDIKAKKHAFLSFVSNLQMHYENSRGESENTDTSTTNPQTNLGKNSVPKQRVPLKFLPNIYQQVIDSSLSVNDVRSLLVRDVWVRWKELQSEHRPVWETQIITDPSLNKASQKALSIETRSQAQQLTPLNGFITPPVEPKLQIPDQYRVKALISRAFEEGFIYPKYRAAYIDVAEKRELSPMEAKEKAKALNQTISSEPGIPHPGGFLIPVYIYDSTDASINPICTTAFINRLEWLFGLTAFKVLPGHELYDKIMPGAVVHHPLNLIKTPQSYGPFMHVPIVKVSPSDELERKILSMDSKGRGQMAGSNPQYLFPVFAGNDEQDFELATDKCLSNVVKSVDIHGEVNLNGIPTSIITPTRRIAELGGKVTVYLDYDYGPNVTKTVVLTEGMKTIPIGAANEVVYRHLEDVLIPAAEDAKISGKKDPYMVPGLIEKVMNIVWRLNTHKVLQIPAISEYFGEKLQGEKRNEFDEVYSPPPAGSLKALVTRTDLQIGDFAISKVMKNPEDGSVFDISNLQIPLELYTTAQPWAAFDQRKARFKAFEDMGLHQNVALDAWANEIISATLDWSDCTGTDFNEMPIMINNDEHLRKKLLLLAALNYLKTDTTSPDSSLAETQHKVHSMFNSMVFGQSIYSPSGLNLGKAWNLNTLQYFRNGFDFVYLDSSDALTKEQEPTDERRAICNRTDRYTLKSFDMQRLLLLDTLNPMLSQNPCQWNDVGCLDAQGILAIFHSLSNVSKIKFMDDKGYKVTKDTLRYDRLNHHEYIHLTLPYEKYILYVLQQAEKNYHRMMTLKQFYEAKQVVDDLILQISGNYRSALMCDILDFNSLPRKRIQVAKAVYTHVVKTLCFLAYPFYPFVAQTVYGSLFKNSGEGRSLQKYAYNSEMFRAEKNSTTRFLSDYNLIKEVDFVPGNMMFKICEEIQSLIAQGLVLRPNVRAFIIAEHNTSLKSFTESLGLNFGYRNFEDISRNNTLVIKRMCKIKRLEVLKTTKSIFNFGRVAVRKLESSGGIGLYLHVFDDREWLSNAQFKDKEAHMEGNIRVNNGFMNQFEQHKF